MLKHRESSSNRASLAGNALLGFLAAAGQTVGGRLVGFASQFAIAYVMTPTDFGRVALSLTVVALTSILQSAGLAEVLINRRSAFRGWTSTAQWLAVYLGLAAGGLTLTLSPMAAALYGDTHLIYLGSLYAIGQFISAYSVVPVASLQKDLRFVELAKVNLGASILSSLSLVVCAFLGFGAYSFPVSRIVSAGVTSVASRMLAKLNTVSKPRPKMAMYLLGQSYIFLLISFTSSLSQQMDYFALRLYHTASEVGFYYFAFSIAGKTAQLIGGSVTAVVHPILSQVNRDPLRQADISVRLISLVTSIGYPLSFLQAAVMPMVFTLFLPSRWQPATEITQILSVGLGANMVSGICWGLLKVQGKAKRLLLLNSITVSAFSIGCVLVAKHYPPIAIALLVVVHCVVYTQILVVMLGYLFGFTILKAFRLVAYPFIICGGLAIFAYYSFGFGTHNQIQELPRLIAYSIVYYVICFAMIVIHAPNVLPDLSRCVPARYRGRQ